MSRLTVIPAFKVAAVPAAGANCVLTSNEDLLIRAVFVALVTDANVANRQVHFTFENASGVVYARFTAGGTQAASLTRQYSGQPTLYASPAVADTNFVVAMPPDGIVLPNGGKIKTVTTLIQATDAFGALTAYGERV